MTHRSRVLSPMSLCRLMGRWHYLAITLLCAVTAGLTFASSLPAPSTTTGAESYLVYRPIGGGRLKGECYWPYTVTVFSTGRVVYEGFRCVRESGKREHKLAATTAEQWILMLQRSGMLDLPYELQSPQDSFIYELELSLDTKSNKIKFSKSALGVPREVLSVLEAIEREVNPYARWTCFPGMPGCAIQ